MNTNIYNERALLSVISYNIYAELPYDIRLVPVSHKFLADGSTRIEMNILVDRDSIRKIVVGKNGAAIGSVGIAARIELENLWKRRVHIFLKVKVAPV